MGSSREEPRQGEGLVRRGALGYIDFTRHSTPERPFESNLGLRDQVAALRWVQGNIRSFGGDYSFWYPSVKVGERHSGYAPVYFYRFDAAPRLVRRMGLDATHGLEMFPLFDRLDGWPGRGMTLLGGRRSFKAVGARMQRWWLRFAATGMPDAAWPRYDESARATVIIDAEDRIERDPRGDRREAWRRFVPHV